MTFSTTLQQTDQAVMLHRIVSSEGVGWRLLKRLNHLQMQMSSVSNLMSSGVVH